MIAAKRAQTPYIRTNDVGEAALLANLSLMHFDESVFESFVVVVDGQDQALAAPKVLARAVHAGRLDAGAILDLPSVLFERAPASRAPESCSTRLVSHRSICCWRKRS